MVVIKKASTDFFALDIGSKAIRLVQLKTSATGNSADLLYYSYITLNSTTATADTEIGARKVGETIVNAINQSGVRTKNVVIGFPSSKTFTTVIELPNISPEEIKNTIKYQIDQYIPMPLADSKYDYAILGPSTKDPNMVEVLISSVAASYTEEKIDFIESLGYNVLAAEPEGLAMLRSLLPAGIKDSRIVIDMGESNTDLAITIGDSPRLVRNIPMGLSTFVKSAVNTLSVQDSQARQFILKFGLARDKLDGHVFRAIELSLDNFTSEINKSVKFFSNKYPNVKISGIILSGYASIIPYLPQFITDKTGLNCSLGNPWQGINVSDEVKSKLAMVAHEFSAVIGLAKRIER